MPEAQPTPSPSPSTPERIEYATGPRRLLRGRRLFRIAALVGLATLAATGAWIKWGPGVQDRARLLQAQRACARFRGLPGQPIIPYSEPYGESVSRYNLNDDWRAAPIAERWRASRYQLAHRPRCLDEFEALLARLHGPSGPWRGTGYGSFWATGGAEAIAFLHERAAPSGQTRLVIVSGNDMGLDNPVLHATVLRPATWREGPADVSAPPRSVGADGRSYMELVLPPKTRLYVGRPDLGDRSHFTLPYRLGNQRGTIDGWLVDAGTVVFQVLDGPLIDSPR